MAGKLVWNGDAIQARIRTELTRRVRRCCLLVVNRAKELLNVEGTAQRGAAGRNKKGQFTKGLRYGANPSKPGEPPHKQRGRLLGSVASEVVGLVGRVGTNLPYGRALEIGTRLMHARPWLKVALNDCNAQIKAILSAPMK